MISVKVFYFTLGKSYNTVALIPQQQAAWHYSDKCLENIKQFHRKVASIPPMENENIDCENRIAKLQKFLENEGLCKQIEYTGTSCSLLYMKVFII